VRSAKGFGDALADEDDLRRLAGAVWVGAAAGDLDEGGNQFVAGQVRAVWAVERQDARRTPRAATEVEDREGPVREVSAEAARDGAPVGPVLTAVDGIELPIGHGGVGRGDGPRVGRAEADAFAREGPLTAPLAPAHRQDISGAVPADVPFGDAEQGRRF